MAGHLDGQQRAAGSARSASVLTACIANQVSPGRCPARGPRASTRRTTSASKPIPAAKAKRRPLIVPSVIVRVRRASAASRIFSRRLAHLVRHAERARQHARAAGRQQPDGDLGADAVQHVVRRAVAGEHHDRVVAEVDRLAREVACLAGVLGR